MIIVNKDCEYRMENVLSIRKKMTQPEIQQTLVDMGNVIKSLGANKNGPLVTSTFGMEQTSTGPKLDMEILIPLDKEVTVQEPYIFKPLFHLKYAVYADLLPKKSINQKVSPNDIITISGGQNNEEKIFRRADHRDS